MALTSPKTSFRRIRGVRLVYPPDLTNIIILVGSQYSNYHFVGYDFVPPRSAGFTQTPKDLTNIFVFVGSGGHAYCTPLICWFSF